MFYYLLHIPLIHVTSLAAWYLRDGSVHAEWFATAPFVQMPPEQQWGLALLYLVFAIDVARAVRRVPLVCGRQGAPARTRGCGISECRLPGIVTW